ncbi:MAG: glutamine synthetase type III [Ruminococcaceae bacterium]|nr:glutamine synthetase type III [Oscillospiraceae bacterium]
MEKITDYFGCNVFNDSAMKEYLPEKVYKELKNTIEQGTSLDKNIAGDVALAMKEWAIEKGATHFTHWFQPMTGITAEKHDSFITPTDDGKVILEFSGKELIKGEADGSSFPTGGLRATFEARGYTAWDPTSYAFVKDGSLCIPTAFYSHGGHALDKKTPLVRSMQSLNDSSLRLIRLFGNTDAKTVKPTVGAEQEYFLVDKKLYDKREDLRFCGRTLFGAPAPKGQELGDHYYGVIRPRVSAFMKELDKELWMLGIPSKTKHNEAAPAQHEMAPVFTTVNTATDHNQLTMEILKKVAEKHGLVCLLHEKPFGGLNGSGKHNNWSLCTDTGINLLNPGKTPSENIQFLLILTAVIRAVDKHQDLLRLSVASAGNDHRLGGHEAPPAIVSMFLGDELTDILDSIETGSEYTAKARERMDFGVKTMPSFKKATTDRNRTSPFAFTGNKFEFRMLGAPMSIAGVNTILNTIIAEAFDDFSDRLEKSDDFESEVLSIIRDEYKAHKRIIFDGDGYSEEWQKEAEKRGLLNYPDAVAALPHYTDKKNIDLFAKYNVYSEIELHSRESINIERYNKKLHIEGLTALRMAKEQILPVLSKVGADLSLNLSAKEGAGLSAVYERKVAEKLSQITDGIFNDCDTLENAIKAAELIDDILERAKAYRDNVIPAMNSMREKVDTAEALVDENEWPYPNYCDLLFSV